jgi:hypothetical protein
VKTNFKSRLKHSLYIFLAASFALHMIFWLGLNFSDSFVTAPPQKEYIEFDIQTAQTKDLKQVIEQDEKAANDETPEKTKFLGRHSQSWGF